MARQKMDDMMSSMNPAQVQKYLSGINFPVNKQGIIDYVKAKAPSEVMDMLNKISDKTYNGPTEVTKELAK